MFHVKQFQYQHSFLRFVSTLKLRRHVVASIKFSVNLVFR